MFRALVARGFVFSIASRVRQVTFVFVDVPFIKTGVEDIVSRTSTDRQHATLSYCSCRLTVLYGRPSRP